MSILPKHILLLILLIKFVDIVESSTQAIGVPCTYPSKCPFQEGCVNKTDTGEIICICRLEHMKEDGKTWKENFTSCTTGYSPWNIGSYEGGVKIESPTYEYERVPDFAIQASGTYDGYKTHHARLRENLGKGGWCAPVAGTQLIQIDLGVKTKVKMIALQGLKDSSARYMVKTFRIRYMDSLQDADTYYMNKSGNAIDYTGNSNPEDIVYNFFDPPIEAKFIRIEPITFENLRCLRLELYGNKRMDECKSQWNKCDKNVNCNNTLSAYTCKCPSGMNDLMKNGMKCEAVDECKDDRPGLKNNCHKDANCRNTDASFECVCKPGYQGDGVYCEDIDECEDNKHSCIPHTATCTNTVGGYECACKSGFKGDGRSECEDIDESKKGHDCG